MPVLSETIRLSTRGNADVIDVTPELKDILSQGNINSGIVTVSVIGSTGAMTTCEYEPGLKKDIGEILDKLIPPGQYNHDQTWGDGNGHSHLRSSFIGPSVTIPFNDKTPVLGTWQQVIFIDFDNRSRNRELAVQVIGE